MAIVLTAAAAAIGVVVLLAITLGWPGLAIGTLGIMTGLAAYRLWIQPWQHRWGATDQEVHRTMGGDDLIPDAASTTRAITIAAPAEQIWPWLVQLGHGRAGWYSYDWIDNDGQPSGDRIIPELQQLQVGDQILMVPEWSRRWARGSARSSPTAASSPATRKLASDAWPCNPAPGGCRLVSRWRVNWPLTPATAFWILVSDPGAFIMERKMLKGIRSRAEAMVRDRNRRLLQIEHW